MRILAKIIVIFFAYQGYLHAAQAETNCENESRVDAKKIFYFYVGTDIADTHQILFVKKIKRIHDIINPSNKKQKLQVYEARAYVYKAQYRMRTIYYANNGECLLMGQEILELASP